MPDCEDRLVNFVRSHAHPTLEHKASYLLGSIDGVLLEALEHHFDSCIFCDEEMAIWKEVIPSYAECTVEELVGLMCKMQRTVDLLLMDVTNKPEVWERHEQHGRRS